MNFKSITWTTSEIWGIENQENEKFFEDYRKLNNLFPVGLIFSDTSKDTFLTGIDFIVKKKAGEDRKWRSTRLTPQHVSTTQDLSPLQMSCLYL